MVRHFEIKNWKKVNKLCEWCVVWKERGYEHAELLSGVDEKKGKRIVRKWEGSVKY